MATAPSPARPARRAIPIAIVWPWILVSLILHGIVALVTTPIVPVILAFAHPGADLGEGGGEEWGHGFNGDSVELEIAGPDEEEPPEGSMPMAEDLVAGAPVPTPVEEESSAELTPLTQERSTWRVRARPETVEPRLDDERDATEAVEIDEPAGTAREDSLAGGDEPAAPGPEENDPSGMDAESSTSGEAAGSSRDLILGSVGIGGDLAGASRAMLPDQGMCSDPAAGTWRAQRYDAGRRQWVQFTLHVRRGADNALSGVIFNRSWSGPPGSTVPPPCTPFGFDMTWRMPARGRVTEDGHMVFEARSVRLERSECPESGHLYYPDRFRGTVDGLHDRFDAVNNDGQAEFDQPYTFRRVSCN
ncbi:MAG: hypothetical protein AB7S26_26115 [Sandaracinaceae bacterium]